MFQIQQQGVVGNHDTPAFEQLIRAIARGTGSHELACYACSLSLGGQDVCVCVCFFLGGEGGET